jgi:hypothetical protein
MLYKGKTTIASLIIAEVRKLEDATVLFFYCNHNSTEKNTFHALLRSLITQIVHQSSDVIPYVYDKCSTTSEVIVESLDLLEEIVETILRNIGPTFIIIDGLDEFDRRQRKRLLAWITSIVLVEGNTETLRILALSQDEGDIKKRFSTVPAISLLTQQHNDDIEEYSRQKSSTIQQKFSLSLVTKNQIIDSITERAKGQPPTDQQLTLTLLSAI